MSDYIQGLPVPPAPELSDEQLGKIFRSATYGLSADQLTQHQRDLWFMARQAEEILRRDRAMAALHIELQAARREAERKNRPWIRIIVQRVTE